MEDKINYYEQYFECWLQELQDLGIIITYEKQPESFKLFEARSIAYLEQLKTKVNSKSWNLFQPIIYTADFKIVFNKNSPFVKNYVANLGEYFGTNAPQKFLFFTTKFTRTGHPVVIVDVKPPAQAIMFSKGMTSSTSFPIKQRVLYDTQDIYVNKVIPYGSRDCLFGKTFTPKKFFMTDTGKKVRAIPKHRKTKKPLYETRLIEEFINQ